MINILILCTASDLAMRNRSIGDKYYRGLNVERFIAGGDLLGYKLIDDKYDI